MVGYWSFDTVFMFLFFEDLLKKEALGTALFVQMMIHHVLGVTGVVYALSKNLVVFKIFLTIMMEYSSPFLNFRTLMKMVKAPEWAIFLVSVPFVFVFIAVRILPILPSLFLLRQCSWEKCPPMAKFLTFMIVPVPICLNLYWFSLIVEAIINLIMGFSR